MRVDRERLLKPPSRRRQVEAALDHGAVEGEQPIPRAEPERVDGVSPRLAAPADHDDVARCSRHLKVKWDAVMAAA